MARTKQTARKHLESPKKASAVKKSPAKKSAGNKVLRTNMTNTENDVPDEGKTTTSPSGRIATRVRIPYDLDRDLGAHMLFIFIGQHFEITSLHTSLLPAETCAVLEEWSYQPNQHSTQRLYFFDELPETFELYRRYLYSEAKALQSWHGDSDQDFADDGDAEAHEDREWIRLAHAYLLGLRLRDEDFCNVVVNGLVEKMTETDRYPTGLAADVYANTAPGDKLRSLIVDLHIWKGLGTWISAPHNDASGPPAFINDVQTGLATAGDAIHDPDIPMPWEVDLCQYHTHGVTAKCERLERATAPPSEATMRSKGELVLDEGEVEGRHSPPKTPNRSPRTGALASVDKKASKTRTPKRR